MSKLDERVKKSFQTKNFHIGLFSLLTSLAVIAIAIVLNLLVHFLPNKVTNFDLTAANIYTLSEQSEQLLTNLDQDIDVYLIVQSGKESEPVQKILDRYASYSDHIKLHTVDPITQPGFLPQYTDAKAVNNSVLVVSDIRSQYVSYEELFVYSKVFDYGNNQEKYSLTFGGESALTAAVDYVTSKNLPKMYCTTGHGEGKLFSTLERRVNQENITIEYLSLLAVDAVPEDCDILFLYAPKQDLSQDEKEIILAYLAQGGSLMLVTNYAAADLPNLAEIEAYYGVAQQPGVIVEGDSNYSLRTYQHYLLPDLHYHDITTPIINGGAALLLPVSSGIVQTLYQRSTLTVDPLLSTSESSYTCPTEDGSITYEKLENSVEGPFDVSVAITDSTAEGTAHMVWFASEQMLSEELNTSFTLGNADLLLNSLNWLCDREDRIAVHAKNMDSATLTISGTTSLILITLMLGVLPLGFLLFGGIVRIKRRKH